MATGKSGPKLIAIVGPTASGKSDLAMRLAKKFNGEIIAADSRTIYKGMDIGTAKPSQADQRIVRHWGLDLIEPGQRFSAAQFKEYAQSAIADIQSRNKMPILVGGTGLYIDALLFDFGFMYTSRLRRFFYSIWSEERLQKLIKQRGWPLPENYKNKRHLVATAVRRGGQGTRQERPLKNVAIIGLLPADRTLKFRINSRAELMFVSGVKEEANKLAKKYGKKALKATGGIVYKICLDELDGLISHQRSIELFKSADWQYARRQKTWFKRNKFIQWFESPEDAYASVSRSLNKQIGA